MREEIQFFRCSICGNFVETIKNGGGQLVCFGKPMEKIQANTTDAAVEKHVPVAERKDGALYIKVGSVEHPMTEAHYIEWIAVVYANGIHRVILSPGDKPEITVCDREKADIYAYCNLHGLWKTTI